MNAGKGFPTNNQNLKNNYFPFGIPEIYYIVFPTKNRLHRVPIEKDLLAFRSLYLIMILL